jgi:hypothetical protein
VVVSFIVHLGSPLVDGPEWAVSVASPRRPHCRA